MAKRKQTLPHDMHLHVQYTPFCTTAATGSCDDKAVTSFPMLMLAMTVFILWFSIIVINASDWVIYGPGNSSKDSWVL